MQHVDDLPTLKIHEDGPVPGSFQPTPVIDANYAERPPAAYPIKRANSATRPV
jgi:hypothetical protein